jgi:OOP family OmpA-OmpF porin
MKYLPCLLAILFISANATAVEVKERGAYIGGAVGATELEDDGAFDGPGITFDDSDTGLQLWGGYKFFKWFAVEGKFAYLGEASVSAGSDSIKLEASALTANAVFILPFGNSGWDIYGQLGLGVLAYDYSSNFGFSEDGSELTATAGLGVRWTIIDALTLSLGVDAYVWEDEPYDPSIAISKLGIQYNF